METDELHQKEPGKKELSEELRTCSNLQELETVSSGFSFMCSAYTYEYILSVQKLPI